MAPTTRPGAMRASVCSWLTSMASGTSPTRATSGPSVTDVVEAAMAPRSGKQEMAGRSGRPIGKRWSYTKTPSSPAPSARRAASSAVSGSNRKLGSTTPTRIRGRPPRTVYKSGCYGDRFCTQFAKWGRSPAGQQGGADGPGPVPQAGRHNADLGPVLGPLYQFVEGLAGGDEQQVAGVHQAAADDEAFGVEHVGQVGQPQGEPPGEGGQHGSGVVVTFGRRAGHVL